MSRLVISRLRVLLFITASAFALTACNSNNLNSPSQPAADSAPTPGAPGSSPAANPAAPARKVNLNTATPAEFLAAIPNLGNRMVHEFEEYRPWRSVLQFRKEIGKYVSPDQVAEYEKHVFVPIDPNQSDAATLQQIPGLDESEAAALIAGRPYASPQAFLAKLADKISAADLDIARTFLSMQ